MYMYTVKYKKKIKKERQRFIKQIMYGSQEARFSLLVWKALKHISSSK